MGLGFAAVFDSSVVAVAVDTVGEASGSGSGRISPRLFLARALLTRLAFETEPLRAADLAAAWAGLFALARKPYSGPLAVAKLALTATRAVASTATRANRVRLGREPRRDAGIFGASLGGIAKGSAADGPQRTEIPFRQRMSIYDDNGCMNAPTNVPAKNGFTARTAVRPAPSRRRGLSR